MNSKTRELLLEVRRLYEAAHDAQTELLAASGLGACDRRLLDVLAAADSPRTAHELARSMFCARSTVETLLRPLHVRGWVDEHLDAMRSKHVFGLSTAGRTALGALRQMELRLEHVVQAGLDDDEMRRAIDVLRKARRRLHFVRQAPRLRPPPETRSSEALSATASAA